jgi:HEAT repeat protein
VKLGRLTGVFALALGALVVAPPAGAVVWPDVAERIERDLTAPDVATRRAAARELPSLSRKRGGPMALAALQDPDDDVRLSAAEAAIRLRAAGATEGVLSWLNGSDVRIRRKACEVARALPSPAAVAPLARSLGDLDPEVRAAAAAALGRQASADAVAPLLGRLDDPAPAVRVRIVEALAGLADARAVVPLVSKVQDSSPEVRVAVARALGELGDPRASPALVLALRDTSNDVRREAIVAMGRMRSADAVDALAPLLGDRVQALRIAAFDALGAIATRDAVRLLIGALGKADDAPPTLDRTPVRAALVAAGQSAIAPLGELLRSGAASPASAASAAWVVGALHAHEQAESLVDAMRRGVLPAGAAMHALAGAGTEASIPVVLEYVDDPAAVVRDEALGAALALLDPARADGRAVEPLTAALRDPHLTAPERLRAVALLGRTGAARAAPFLVGLASSSDEALRLAAIDALASLGPSASAADDVLLGALTAPDPRLRLHAAVALGETASAAAIGPLLAKLDGSSEIDRASVLTALVGVAARTPALAVVDHVTADLRLAAGAERDALLEVLGVSALPRALDALVALGTSATVEDRRTVAALCAAHRGDARAVTLARSLLSDADGATRAEAAWALGSIGEAVDVARLAPLLRGDDAASAADAAAAIGRVATRAGKPGDASAVLCAALGDSRPLVRSDALAGLAIAHARCEGGVAERDILAGDSSEQARAAAARVLAVAPNDADRAALTRCARQDPSVRVASACSAGPAAAIARTRRTRVYVVPEGADAPRPLAPYALVYGDGTVRLGAADRRGAVVDPVAPDAEMRLTTAGE